MAITWSFVFLGVAAALGANADPFFGYESFELLGTESSHANDLRSTYSNVSPVQGPDGMTAWEFKGNKDSYVKFDDTHLNGIGSFTIGTFFLQKTLKNGPILEWRGATGNYGTHFWIWGNTLFTNLDPLGKGKAFHYKAPKLGTWRFVGVSYNAVTGDFYMWDEDQVFHKNTGKLANLDQTGPVYIGIRPKSTTFNPFLGKLAGLILLKGAITKDQIPVFREHVVRHSARFFGYHNYQILTTGPSYAGHQTSGGHQLTYSDVSLVEGPHGLTAWEFKGRQTSFVKVSKFAFKSHSFTIGTFFYQDKAQNGPIFEWRGGQGTTKIYGTHFWIWGGTIFTNLDPIGKGSAFHWKKPVTGKWTFIGVSYNADSGDFMMWENDQVFHKNVGKLAALDQNGDAYIGIRPGQPTYNPLKAKLAGLTVLDDAIIESEIHHFEDSILA